MGKGPLFAVTSDTPGHPCCLGHNTREHGEALGSVGATLLIGIYGGNQVQRAVKWTSGDQQWSAKELFYFFNNKRQKSWD